MMKKKQKPQVVEVAEVVKTMNRTPPAYLYSDARDDTARRAESKIEPPGHRWYHPSMNADMRFAREWSRTRLMSVCECGHTGDGRGSQHDAAYVVGEIEHGHGACLAPDCACRCFTWVGWTPEFAKTLGSPPTN